MESSFVKIFEAPPKWWRFSEMGPPMGDTFMLQIRCQQPGDDQHVEIHMCKHVEFGVFLDLSTISEGGMPLPLDNKLKRLDWRLTGPAMQLDLMRHIINHGSMPGECSLVTFAYDPRRIEDPVFVFEIQSLTRSELLRKMHDRAAKEADDCERKANACDRVKNGDDDNGADGD